MGLADAPFPLTATLSPRRGRTFGWFLKRRRFMVAMQVPRTLKLSMNRGEPVAYIWRNPFRVVKTRCFQPRVASQARQPWALRRNPFGIRGLRLMVPIHAQSETNLSMNRWLENATGSVGNVGPLPLGERRSCARLMTRFMVPMHTPRMLKLPKEREHRGAFRIAGTVWCMRPRRVQEAKAGSPLRSAPALHREGPRAPEGRTVYGSHYSREIFLRVAVVDFPGTNGMITILPPAASTVFRSSAFSVSSV